MKTDSTEPELYCHLLYIVYKFRKIIGKNDFPYLFKIIVRFKKIGYNIDATYYMFLSLVVKDVVCG